MRLILGSASPRRLQLLEQIGIVPDEVRSIGIPEDPARGERPRDLARRLARGKAAAIAVSGNDVVLSADTVVALGRRVLGKPRDRDEADGFLRMLSGRRHRVITAIALRSVERIWLRDVMTIVRMKSLSEAERRAYVDSGEWRDKAGGYAIQGLAAAFVQRVNGSYSNVVGLPLSETAGLLAGAGYPVAAAWPRQA